ncbi:MAG: ATP-binding protein [Desulfobacterales bacterium]|nr:ATP-binding protein [Desulfobacterales bacterium]
MKSLYVKIFVWFWGAMLALGMVLVVSTLVLSKDSLFFQGREKAAQLLKTAGRVAVGLHNGEKEVALARFFSRVEEQSGRRLFLFKGEGLIAPQSSLPRGAAELVGKALGSDQVKMDLFRRNPIVAARVRDWKGIDFVILAQLPRGVLYRLFHPGSRELIRISLVVLASGIICLLLARHLTRPIRRLKDAAHTISKGDFSHRVGPDLGSRRDEIYELGKSFDDMAGRVQALIQGRTRLMRDISHELRSPLARMNIALELVRKKSNPQVQPLLNRMENELSQMNDLIGRTLTLARMEDKDTPLEIQDLDLESMIEAIIADAAFEAGPGRFSLVSHACPPIPGNPDLIRSAVENLVRNALKHTPGGTPVKITIVQAGEHVRIQVRDRGPGVAPDELADLFKPFYQARTTDQLQPMDRARGTGLGLAIVQGAVIRHGGKVRARNHPRGGLEVTLTLPISSPSLGA